MTFVPDQRDRDGLQDLLVRVRKHDGHVEVKCFSKDEAYWIREQLEASGVDVHRITWLEFGERDG